MDYVNCVSEHHSEHYTSNKESESQACVFVGLQILGLNYH